MPIEKCQLCCMRKTIVLKESCIHKICDDCMITQRLYTKAICFLCEYPEWNVKTLEK